MNLDLIRICISLYRHLKVVLDDGHLTIQEVTDIVDELVNDIYH